MAELTLREAAIKVGVSRQTVYRMVKTGKLSATLRFDGQKVVDTTELLRVFGRLTPATVTRPDVESPGVTGRETAPLQPNQRPQAMSAADVSREVQIAGNAALTAELRAAKTALEQAQDRCRRPANARSSCLTCWPVRPACLSTRSR